MGPGSAVHREERCTASGTHFTLWHCFRRDDERLSLENALKLRFNRRLVDDRPYFLDSLVSKFIEYVFGKRNSLPVHMETKQQSFRRAVEAQPARDKGRLGNQQMDIKIEIRNRTKIF